MRIDRLEIENFKKYKHLLIELNENFTLLIGENGSGKTTILDALAIAASVWVESEWRYAGRQLDYSDLRQVANEEQGQLSIETPYTARVGARGQIAGRHLEWVRELHQYQHYEQAQDEAQLAVEDFRSRALKGEIFLLPVLAYYKDKRAWSSGDYFDPDGGEPEERTYERWHVLRDMCDGLLFRDLRKWFEEQNSLGPAGSGPYKVVLAALLRCIPDASDVRLTSNLEIVVMVGGNWCAFEDFSAGQRMMFALVANLAIKCVTQNAYLIPPDELPLDGSLPEVLKQTPGLVLIDELDVHLHPRWQRRIVKDLKETFPAIQFVCTSHSPQIVGELRPEEIRVLKGEKAHTPARSFGIDSSRLLEELMGAEARDPGIAEKLKKLFHEIDQEDFNAAKQLLPDLEDRIGRDDPELVRARALMDFLEADLS
jgi:predicted ATP-binding protein involved in virulence